MHPRMHLPMATPTDFVFIEQTSNDSRRQVVITYSDSRPILMAFSTSALQSAAVRLKPTQTCVRYLSVGTKLDYVIGEDDDPFKSHTEEEIHNMKVKHVETNLDRIVEQLDPQETIPVIARKLTLNEGEALLAHSKHSSEKITGDQLDSAVQKLKEDLQKMIESIGGHEKGCFVKLSCRSPKDATAISTNTLKLYKGCLPLFTSSNPTQSDAANSRLCAMYYASLQAMKVYSAEEALELLLDSKRIAFDLKLDLQFPEEFTTSIIVRPWISIPLHSEFRAFVCNGKMNAISQYYSWCYFETLAQKKDQYLQWILEFFERIQQKIKLVDYVIDFVVLDSGQVLVLELNPFNPSTGGCLFDWKNDQKILKEGPLEFRILPAAVVHSLHGKLNANWEEIVFDSSASEVVL